MKLLLAAVLLCGLLLLPLCCAWGPPANSSKDPLATLGNKSKVMTTKTSNYSRSAYDIALLPNHKIDELAKRLSKEDADVILKKGTERAFCGTLLDNKMHGTYICKLCSLPLFSSESKFNSGTGWPAFSGNPLIPTTSTTRKTMPWAWSALKSCATLSRSPRPRL